jgi:hypothetical protein
MTLIGRRFGLSIERGSGIFCDESGLFVGGVPMLERSKSSDGAVQWRPRPADELNRDLSKRYGVPIEIHSNLERVAAIARALGRGDVVFAMMAAVHLDFPDPPQPRLPIDSRDHVELLRGLRASGLLKADWDPSKHPRWPAGSGDGVGGQFAPVSTENGASGAVEPTAAESAATLTRPADIQSVIPLTPVSATTLPIPFEIPGFSMPSEIAPGSVLPPTLNPIHIPRNPYPGRPKCVKEWAEAQEDCVNLWADGLLGTENYRGMGKTVAERMMGRVSQDCGGNRYDV